MLTQKELKSQFTYNSKTGVFVRTKHYCSTFLGVAGSVNTRGYRIIKINYKNYKASQLAYLYVHGKIPSIVDHINGIKADDRIVNLRAATHGLNSENIRTATKASKLGVLGVCKPNIGWNLKKPYKVNISVGGRNVYLGYYATIEAAHAVYVKAKRKLHKGCTI